MSKAGGIVAHRPRGVALAGGGPLGAIYEIGALVALDEALCGFSFVDCDVYVGVSSGSFIVAGLANGLTPQAMYRMFIASEAADDPFEPDVLLRPNYREYGRRLASLPRLVAAAAEHYLQAPWSRGLFESSQQLARALPTGMFDSSRIGAYLAKLFSAPGRTDDFRALRHKLFLVATDLDSGEAVPFGARGRDAIPISQAVLASAALPGLFPPVEIAGRHYVDGALVKTLHASVALRAGVKLLLCINPLVPFDADAEARGHRRRRRLVEGGLPTVLAQTFRAIIHSRMRTGMGRYRTEFPDADVLLFEPPREDADIFFANVFSYADRRRLSEHSYRRTRAELWHRYAELAPVLARHGVTLDKAVLADERRTLADRAGRR
ncbi:MAG TPA: patatin-like phospholipase family protein, partial [Xanthobacteraceae bacterium]|nr:patatin-like phospholipase family protein [Xanthobacteraceae bacterium]